MPRILPREGLYIDPIVSLLQSTLLNPLLTTPAAYLEYFGLRHSRAAKSLVILGLIYRINSFLNKCANNNWRLGRSDWNWEKELVLVTGGSSGIGASVARQLANKGINVVVLDVQPLTYDSRSHPHCHYIYHPANP